MESEDPQRFQIYKKKITVQKYVTFIILLLYSTANSVIYYYSYSDLEFYQENLSTFNAVLVVSRVIKIIVDIFFHAAFARVIIYLFNYGIQYSSDKKKINGLFQSFLLFLVIFLYVFSFFHAILMTIGAIYQVSNANYKKTEFNNLILIMVFIVFPIKDFFIALSFTYLYYTQGRKMES